MRSVHCKIPEIKSCSHTKAYPIAGAPMSDPSISDAPCVLVPSRSGHLLALHPQTPHRHALWDALRQSRGATAQQLVRAHLSNAAVRLEMLRAGGRA